MNDKDKEAFKNWYTNKESEFDNCKEAWQAACEHKQKEIDELEKEKDYLCQKMENMRLIYKNSEKLQAENAKLRECVEEISKMRQEVSFYTEPTYPAILCIEILKELEDK